MPCSVLQSSSLVHSACLLIALDCVQPALEVDISAKRGPTAAWVAKDIVQNGIQRLFREFLHTFSLQGERVYQGRLREMCACACPFTSAVPLGAFQVVQACQLLAVFSQRSAAPAEPLSPAAVQPDDQLEYTLGRGQLAASWFAAPGLCEHWLDTGSSLHACP